MGYQRNKCNCLRAKDNIIKRLSVIFPLKTLLLTDVVTIYHKNICREVLLPIGTNILQPSEYF